MRTFHPRGWVQVRHGDEWRDHISAPHAKLAEHVERLAKSLGKENVRIKP